MTIEELERRLKHTQGQKDRHLRLQGMKDKLVKEIVITLTDEVNQCLDSITHL